MKKYYITSVLLFAMFVSFYAQTTAIPDARFEQKLIDLGYDDVRDKAVLTANISGVKTLEIVGLQYQEIYDLIGIEAFTSLEVLHCNLNKLSSLDLSNNVNLKELICSENTLTSINLNGCTKLTSVVVDLNLLPELDLSTNTSLTYLKCFSNRLTTLDLSVNTQLYYVRCASNPLTFLNMKNGNNGAITSFDSRNCASLSCIQVDNATLANNGDAPYNIWKKDAATVYSEDCSALSVSNEDLHQMVQLYPNPVKGYLNVLSEAVTIERIEMYSILGKKVKQVTSNFEYIAMMDLPKGIYFVKIMCGDRVVSKKILKK